MGWAAAGMWFRSPLAVPGNLSAYGFHIRNRTNTYDISAQRHDGRTVQCWDERFVVAEQLVEWVETVGEAGSAERRCD